MNLSKMLSRKTLSRRRILAASGAALTLPTLGLPGLAYAQADTYPNKPLRFIVSFPAGSATDQVARLVAPQITKQTGQTVIVDNRGGASGFIASEAVEIGRAHV